MKSIVSAVFLASGAAGTALGMAPSPVSRDPNLTWVFLGVAAANFVLAAIFYTSFRLGSTFTPVTQELGPTSVHAERDAPKSLYELD